MSEGRVTQERMEVWPEDRIRARAAAGGGRLRVRVEGLLAEFGARRSTPLDRHGVERALREGELAGEPSLQDADLDSYVTISLTGEENGAVEWGTPAATGTEPPGGPLAPPEPTPEVGVEHHPVSGLHQALTRAKPENSKARTSLPAP